MSKSKKYKTFDLLKESTISATVPENRIADMIADLDDFVKKIKHSKNNVNIKGQTLKQGK